MKQIFAVFAIAVGFSVFADSAVSRTSDVNYTFSLNADWRFTKAPVTIPLAQAKASVETKGVKLEDPAFDDSAWEIVSVPHPINAHDSFDNHAVDAGESSFWRGMAFYRKRFTLDAAPKGKAFLTFETVRQTIYLWVNGKFAGYYEAGIAPTAYDVTALVKAGENVICVATDNTAMRGSKLYALETRPGHEPGDMSGESWQWNTTDFNEVQGGLVGSVSLVLKPKKVYLTLPYYNNLKTVGTYVTARDFDFEKGEATVSVKAEVRNETGEDVKAKVKVKIRDIRQPATDIRLSVDDCRPSSISPAADAGKVYLTSLEGDVYDAAPQPTRLNGPKTTTIVAEGRAKGLVFWSPETPHLYDVTVTLVGEDGTVLDSETIRTGFRHVAYDAAKGGLLVNGRNVWLPGYAQRATDEWAAIGVAPDWLQDYDAALIRRSNANFVRWMHVAPKPAPVRAFDKFGVVNAAPAGDKEGDVSGRRWAQRVEAMRDVMVYYRNSPSVFFWEAGNNAISPAHMKEMVELKKLVDPDGFRFMGCRTLQTKEAVAEAEYVGTMLHRHEMPAFESMAALGKFMPMMETEYARQESPRRSWDDFTPPDYDYRGRFLNGGKKEAGFDVYDQTQEDFALSTAKEYAQFYSSRASGARSRTYACCAALCWTDSNQHGRNSFSENCRSSGRVDAVRIPKMNFDVFRVMQSEDPAVTLVGHWSYPKLTKESYRYPVKKYNGKFMEETGETARRDPLHKTVYAIGSAHCASVELTVNGKSKGVNSSPKDIFVYEFPNVDVTESGVAEVIARDRDGKEIARHRLVSFAGRGMVKATVKTGPKGWLADGSDIAMVDFALVDANGTVHPYASGKISFKLNFEPTTPNSQLSTQNSQLSTQNFSSPVFMGGWNSGTFDETSPVGKDWVNLECGVTRVFVKAGRRAGKATLSWRYEGFGGVAGEQSGTVSLEAKAVAMQDGFLAAPSQSFAPNTHTFARKTDAPAIQDLCGDGARAAERYKVFVNGAEVEFPNGLGAPVKPDDNTGVCCAYAPVLAALVKAGARFEYAEEPKRIPANKKWLRKLSPSPFRPMVTVRAGGREIDACAGFTELFIDNGRDKNLTNCEIYSVGRKNAAMVCGELAALVGYIPGVEMKTDDAGKSVIIKTKGPLK
ncbi:MAG: beta galactosidase jelly roll domain-containing protein [Kiritimatiellae bacterium]|nr:beta galactosidase jelly roll domain-containing protein [Kiritimatiellia bacterium]